MGHKFKLLPVVKLLLQYYPYYMSFILYYFPHLLSSNHKSTHPYYNATQKMEMGWTFMMKTSRGERCPRSIACGVGVFHCCSTREST
jgi:hypothetical protein